MKKFGLIGYPLGHSFSARYFSAKFQSEQLDCAYELFAVSSADKLSDFLAAHSDFTGFNVTIPYKQHIMHLLDEISEDARNIGAVNVVKQTRLVEGKITRSGHNTDWQAFSESLKPLLTKEIRHALILGTGGAAKAVRHALGKLDIKATFVSRRPTDADVTPAVSYDDIDERMMQDNLLIVNASPAGMFPTVEDCPRIPYEYITSCHICYDLVYNPLYTKFMAMGEKHGAKVKNGLEMLERQAELSWKIWMSGTNQPCMNQ